MIQGLIVLNDSTYVYKRWQGTLIYWAVLVISLLVNTVFARWLPMVENATMVLHVCLFIVLFVVIVAVSPTKHSSAFVWTEFDNNSGWSSDGVSWCIGLLSSSYVLVGE